VKVLSVHLLKIVFNLSARWHQRLWFKNNEVWCLRAGVGGESCKIRFLGALPIHLLRPFCCRIYCWATMHSVTDRQMDRQTDVSCQ